ncbi:MAG TPA: EAL domain-containing protein [Allosphingosinicella sp.]|jgi:EAL domain-containing protein (putative c-di-GMP-specific phosphodiesterase class I)/CHASE2 domain-containing sensor protein|nr:EAL domain-containing protein [Allosphingosinicella sp.]
MKIGLERIAPPFLRWRRHAIFAGATLAGLAVLASGGGTTLDRQLRSLRDGLRAHPASGQVEIVEIDEKSIAALDKWPWPRGVHAAVIDRLHAGGARSIAFDVDFSSASTPAEDAKLAAALQLAAGTVSLPTLRQYPSAADTSHFIDTQPNKLLRDKAFLSAVTVIPDSDGSIRQMPLGMTTFDTPRPSLSTLIAEKDAQSGRSFDIDYSIDPATIPRLSVVDLISGKVPARAIAGKRFIVGATAIEIGDRYTVPRYGVIPGVIIQALAAETLLQGAVPWSFGAGWSFAAALLALLLATLLRGRRARVATYALGFAAALGVPLATEAWFALTVPAAPALVALIVGMLLSGAALAFERYLEKALKDDATGLPNLGALEMAAFRKPVASVVVARIDRFAAIASGLGPAATAILVQRVAERLRFACPGTEIYRVEEAGLAWIEDPAEEGSIEDRFDAIAAIMRPPVECGRPIDVVLAFGLACGAELGASQLISNAGLAAVQAAQHGARWRRFIDADGEAIDWQLSLLGELDAAMADGQIWNAYQPKLDIESGKIVAVETLVRWSHPVRGPIGPDSFVPVIEQAGRMRDLTFHVLHQALDDGLAWDKAGHPLGVAVNVSANLLADHEFIEAVGQILESHKLPTSRVTIEVTESAAMDRPEQAIAALESWRALGVGISIDDYGTGQSSLGYLQKLPASELKIDKSFVQTIVTDKRNAIMVRSTIELAHQLGMKVVAEGIEDLACLQLLGEMGCDTGQGYHIGRPMAASALSDFLAGDVRAAA